MGPQTCTPCCPSLGPTNNWITPRRLCTKLGSIPWSQLSPHFCLLPHSLPRPLCPAPFMLLCPELVPPPGEPRFPPHRRTPLNFSKSWDSKSNSALSQAGSVSGVGCGRSVLGCSLGGSDLPEGPRPSFGFRMSACGLVHVNASNNFGCCHIHWCIPGHFRKQIREFSHWSAKQCHSPNFRKSVAYTLISICILFASECLPFSNKGPS